MRFVPLKEFYEMQDDETRARPVPCAAQDIALRPRRISLAVLWPTHPKAQQALMLGPSIVMP